LKKIETTVCSTFNVNLESIMKKMNQIQIFGDKVCFNDFLY